MNNSTCENQSHSHMLPGGKNAFSPSNNKAKWIGSISLEKGEGVEGINQVAAGRSEPFR